MELDYYHAFKRYPEVSGFLLQRRLTGFSPSDTLTLLPTAVTIIFAVLSVHLTLMHIATLKIALNRSLSGQHQHRATVAKNLSSRCILPVFLMTLPVIVASIVINFRVSVFGQWSGLLRKRPSSLSRRGTLPMKNTSSSRRGCIFSCVVRDECLRFDHDAGP